jgi:biopolymer transport protein ExbD
MRLPRQKQQKLRPDLTSLIDVLFILIIFFTVSSTWKEQPALELDLPSAASAHAAPAADVVVTIRADGVTYLGEREVERAELRAEMAKLIDERQEVPPVVISADRQAPHGAVVAVLDVAKELGAHRVLLATEPEESEQP